MVVGFVQLLEKRLGGKLDAETREFIDYAVMVRCACKV